MVVAGAAQHEREMLRVGGVQDAGQLGAVVPEKPLNLIGYDGRLSLVNDPKD